MAAVLTALGVAFALIVAILAIPVRVCLSVTCDGAWRAEARVTWMFGLVRLPLGKPSADRAKPKRGRRRRKRKGFGGRRARAVLMTPGLIPRAARFARDLVARIRVASLRVRARVGLDDPADTGLLWSVVGPTASAAAAAPRSDVDVAPEFGEAACDVHGAADVRVVPAAVAATLLGFLVSTPALRAAWAAAWSR